MGFNISSKLKNMNNGLVNSRFLSAVFAGIQIMLISGCSLNDLVNKGSPPADLIHPSAWENESGALSLYNGARYQLRSVVAGRASVVLAGALMTDELHSVFRGVIPPAFPRIDAELIDARASPDYRGAPITITQITDNTFMNLQHLRFQARVAAKYLEKYFLGNEKKDLISYMLALQAYAVLNLGELYCSGIPIPVYNDDGSFTLTRGFSREEIIGLAIELSDSAKYMAMDSIGVVDFSNLIKAKAYLSLGIFDSAAAAVNDIAVDYIHNVTYSTEDHNFFLNTTSGWEFSVSNEEGINGIDFITSNDPRTLTSNTATRVYFPQKYKLDGTSPVTIASGVEALLIRAESELNDRNTSGWLSILNTLRNSGIQSISTDESDTIWKKGIGSILFETLGQSVPGLSNLNDPGSDSARLSLHFRERAAWLFLTGNRQPDLRRQVRVYGQLEDHVFPTGYWGSARVSFYGTDVNLPVPQSEIDYNELYGGCINRDA